MATSEFRLSVYRRKMYVNPESVTDITGRYRETSPEWYRNNQATTHRLVPWLNRELNVLLETAPYQSAMAIQLILDTIQRHEIRSQEFTEQLLPYLGTRTEHFQHEFFNYARSYYDMVGFDRHAEYVNRPDPPPQPADRPHALPTLQHLNDQRPANETQVISSESSDTDGADDIVVVDEVQADPASRLDDLTARVRRRLARYGRLPLPPGMSIPPILGAPQASTSSSSAVGGATAVPNPTDDPQPSTSSGAASGNQQRIIIPSDSSDSDSSTLRGEDDEDAVEIVDVLPPKKDRHHEVVDLSSSDEAATGTGTAEKEEPKAGSSGASASSAAAAAAASIYDGVPILISSSEEEDEAMAGCSSNITVSPFSLSKKRSALEEQIERVKNSLKSSTANAKQAWSSSDSEDDQDQARDSLVAAVRSTWSSAAEDFENGTAAADDENVPKPKGKGKGKRSRRPENERDRVNPQSTTTANSSSTSTPMATDMRLSGASTEAALTSPVIPSRSDLGHGAQDDSSKSGASRKKRRRKRVRKKLDPKWFSSSSSSSNEDVDNTSSSRGTSAEASRATSALPPGSRSETSEEQPESDDHLPLAMRFGVGKKMSLLELERRLRKRILERTQGNSSSTSGGDQVESGGDRSQLRQEGQDGRRRSDDRSSDEEDESLSERPSKRGKKDARY